MNLIDAAERGWLPDAVIRAGIRRLLRQRTRAAADQRHDIAAFADTLRAAPLAVHTDAANDQHYEAPPEFFEQVLGPRLKYSGCLFENPGDSLATAEDAMLRLTCERAQLADGQSVLELGCGWGSLSLWMAEEFPRSQVLAVSNSNRQREFIQAAAQDRGLSNLEVVTQNMTHFDPQQRFDRIVSVEMFEHMRNYELLFRRIRGWLKPDGRLFTHVFCHRDEPYLFETTGKNDWMGRHFFTGGTMPSVDLFAQFDEHLSVQLQWAVDGMHYWRTCEEWLKNLDRGRQDLVELFGRDMPVREARLAIQRWRMFFMACAELFRYDGGDRWFVAHYLMAPSSEPAVTAERSRAKTEAPSQPSAVL